VSDPEALVIEVIGVPEVGMVGVNVLLWGEQSDRGAVAGGGGGAGGMDLID